jgi:hypothetical protein
MQFSCHSEGKGYIQACKILLVVFLMAIVVFILFNLISKAA